MVRAMRSRARPRFVCAALFSLFSWASCGLVACRGEPPTPKVDAAVAPLPPPPAVAQVEPGEAGAPAPKASTSTGGATASATEDAGPDPGALPQTKDKPTASGSVFDARAAALWEAIVKDDPDRALPFFFPVSAYQQVKAIAYPESDWKRRLVGAYKRDIHALHKRLGEKADGAKLVRMDVPDDRARWVDPNEESNKLGYWRVYGTRIVFDLDGKERYFEVSSLISWRGEWYVVHLTGFK
jgi:hypothetical protein